MINSNLKRLLKSLGQGAILWDILLLPLTLAGIVWFRIARFWGIKRLPLMRASLLKFGMFPIVDHYYDPLFDHRKVQSPRYASRLKFNTDVQLNLLSTFEFVSELDKLPMNRQQHQAAYFYNNGSFGIGDAELYYSIIRRVKPSRIVEVGSGYSTLLALEAIRKNQELEPSYRCKLTCIEPFEMPFLESLDVHLVRERVENMPMTLFIELEENDIVFIDSSHMIRPGGDVLHVILGVLPVLKRGVWVHFHDIFLPEGYPASWLKTEFRFWNEQYLLEAFLEQNEEFEVMAGMNYLRLHHWEEVQRQFPKIAQVRDCQPGSFWIRKT